LPQEGLKADLVNRLQARLDEEEFDMVDVAAPGASATAGGGEAETTLPATTVKATPSETAAASAPRKDAPKKDAPAVEPKAVPAEAHDSKSGGGPLTKEELSFEELKRRRAERFGIPVVEPPVKEEIPGGARKSKRSEPKDEGKGDSNKIQKTGKQGNSEAKKNDKKQVEKKEILPKDEIEKLLKRAEKYNIKDAKTDELKAMLRTYRFSSK
jgi:SAP domain-containing ribonucleoprotein